MRKRWLVTAIFTSASAHCALACGPGFHISKTQLALLAGTAAAPPLLAPTLGCLWGLSGGKTPWATVLGALVLACLLGIVATSSLSILGGIAGWFLSALLNPVVGFSVGRWLRHLPVEEGAEPGLSPAAAQGAT